MNRILFLILFFFHFGGLAYASKPDSSVLFKNELSIHVLGNNYYSGFTSAESFASLNYSRIFTLSHFNFMPETGVGIFKTYWIENQFSQNRIIHRPLSPSFTEGMLMRYCSHPRRSGLWIGAFFTMAFAKQTISHAGALSVPLPLYITYDFQLMPNLCYRYISKSGKISLRASLMCKFYHSELEHKDYLDIAEDDTSFLWGGISFGYSW